MKCKVKRDAIIVPIGIMNGMNVDEKIRASAGIYLCILISVIPMFAWKIGYDFGTEHAWQAVAIALAKIGAFGGMAMFTVSLILSGRYRFYEKLFGGLDKMYVAHRFFCTFSVVLLFLHPVSLSILRLPDGAGESLAIWFMVSDFSIWLGAFALYLFIALVLWTILARARYEVFVHVHRLLGVVFILGASHAFLAGSVLGSNPFMYWYMLVLTLFASFTFVTYSLFGDIFHKPVKYRMKQILERPHGVVELVLQPTSRIIRFAPGQFVYISFPELDGHGYHPFSISSGKQSAELTLSIRKSGDFTNQIDKLKPGTIANVKGPYGGFILRLNSRRKQLWIAGGIGVTPFMSGASSLRYAPRKNRTEVEMVYATADKHPYGIDVLEGVEARNKAFNVTLFDKKTFGHVSFDTLAAQISDIKDRDIYICGPPAMLSALREEAMKAGFAHNLRYEDFSY